MERCADDVGVCVCLILSEHVAIRPVGEGHGGTDHILDYTDNFGYFGMNLIDRFGDRCIRFFARAGADCRTGATKMY